jgi:hypothetical protein
MISSNVIAIKTPFTEGGYTYEDTDQSKPTRQSLGCSPSRVIKTLFVGFLALQTQGIFALPTSPHSALDRDLTPSIPGNGFQGQLIASEFALSPVEHMQERHLTSVKETDHNSLLDSEEFVDAEEYTGDVEPLALTSAEAPNHAYFVSYGHHDLIETIAARAHEKELETQAKSLMAIKGEIGVEGLFEDAKTAVAMLKATPIAAAGGGIPKEITDQLAKIKKLYDQLDVDQQKSAITTSVRSTLEQRQLPRSLWDNLFLPQRGRSPSPSNSPAHMGTDSPINTPVKTDRGQIGTGSHQGASLYSQIRGTGQIAASSATAIVGNLSVMACFLRQAGVKGNKVSGFQWPQDCPVNSLLLLCRDHVASGYTKWGRFEAGTATVDPLVNQFYKIGDVKISDECYSDLANVYDSTVESSSMGDSSPKAIVVKKKRLKKKLETESTTAVASFSGKYYVATQSGGDDRQRFMWKALRSVWKELPDENNVEIIPNADYGRTGVHAESMILTYLVFNKFSSGMDAQICPSSTGSMFCLNDQEKAAATLKGRDEKEKKNYVLDACTGKLAQIISNAQKLSPERSLQAIKNLVTQEDLGKFSNNILPYRPSDFWAWHWCRASLDSKSASATFTGEMTTYLKSLGSKVDISASQACCQGCDNFLSSYGINHGATKAACANKAFSTPTWVFPPLAPDVEPLYVRGVTDEEKSPH